VTRHSFRGWVHWLLWWRGRGHRQLGYRAAGGARLAGQSALFPLHRYRRPSRRAAGWSSAITRPSTFRRPRRARHDPIQSTNGGSAGRAS